MYDIQPAFDEELVLNWELAKPNLRARLLNAKVLPEPEVKRSAKEYMMDDLIIAPYVVIDLDAGYASAPVNYKLLEHWNQSPKNVIDLAMENSRKECTIRDLYKLTMELMPEEFEEEFRKEFEDLEDAPRMLVCSNKDRYYGAIAGILMMKELVETFGTGYTLIPSSVHETIAVNRGGLDKMSAMVREVNQQHVLPKERLSDHVYNIW